jgi:hypothetical protein
MDPMLHAAPTACQHTRAGKVRYVSRPMKAPIDSLDAAALDALQDAWRGLAGPARPDGWEPAVKALAGRFVAHRARLFAANAALQAEATPDDAAMVAATDANQEAIKRCTIALGEMNAALGRGAHFG